MVSCIYYRETKEGKIIHFAPRGRDTFRLSWFTLLWCIERVHESSSAPERRTLASLAEELQKALSAHASETGSQKHGEASYDALSEKFTDLRSEK